MGSASFSVAAMEELDTWRSAHQLLRQHGENAAIVAAQRADALLAEGATEGFRIWQRIVAAINELSRTKPSSGEPTN